jgi:hypothetical protein
MFWESTSYKFVVARVSYAHATNLYNKKYLSCFSNIKKIFFIILLQKFHNFDTPYKEWNKNVTFLENGSKEI